MQQGIKGTSYKRISKREKRYKQDEVNSRNIEETMNRDIRRDSGFLGKAQVILLDLFNDEIKRSPMASIGEPWPLPYKVQYNTSLRFVLNPGYFHFVTPSDDKHCDILKFLMTKYKQEIQKLSEYYREVHRLDVPNKFTGGKEHILVPLYKVTLLLKEPVCNGVYPSLHMDETYEIELSEEKQVIRANEVWGLIRGVETFYQLLHGVRNTSGELQMRSVWIYDRPAYPHRGVLIDTGRHYLHSSTIKAIISAMSQNKLNVLHWHMVDDQSFPFQSQKFPELWKKGAFSPHLVYSPEDIHDIIEYARLHAVRVMPEFDTPGHTRSWSGVPGLLARCGKKNQIMTGVFDVTNENTYNIMHGLYTEVKDIFKDTMVHLGGDEISAMCWYLNTTLRKMLETSTHDELIDQYFQRLHGIISSISSDWVPVVWEEVLLKHKVKLDPKKTVVQIWYEGDSLHDALMQGFRVIYSACWYLNIVSTKPDWQKLYDCVPGKDISKTGSITGTILGGEACVWGEYIDDSNIEQIMWPRALATAERLWSNPSTPAKDRTVKARFQEQACRMQRRGVKVSPHTGPGHCVT